MVDSSQIREHMEVVSSDNHHVGRVDCVKGDRVELAKLDLQAIGNHHLIPLAWVSRVDDKVHLNLTRDAAKAGWQRD